MEIALYIALGGSAAVALFMVAAATYMDLMFFVRQRSVNARNLRDGSAGAPTRLSGAEVPNSDLARSNQWRQVGLDAQILCDFGVHSIRPRTDSLRKYVVLTGFGIERGDRTCRWLKSNGRGVFEVRRPNAR